MTKGRLEAGPSRGELVRSPPGQALAPGCFLGAPRAPFAEAAALVPPSLRVKCPELHSHGCLGSISQRLKVATTGS